MQMMECSYSHLGMLKPGPLEEPVGVVINGVLLPSYVIEELRMLGLPLGWYNRGELEDAVMACAVDRKLVDDAGGLNFRDKLTLTHAEQLAQSRKKHAFFFPANDDEEETPGYLH